MVGCFMLHTHNSEKKQTALKLYATSADIKGSDVGEISYRGERTRANQRTGSI